MPVSATSPSPTPIAQASLTQALAASGYVLDDALATALWLAITLERPLLVEGPAGVGKTSLATTLSLAMSWPLVRLQCYEGLDEGKSLYEWDFAKQMMVASVLRERVPPASTKDPVAWALSEVVSPLYRREMLLERPLLRSLETVGPSVLLIDEVDRADPEFEALLLELLSERQITIPELGTLRVKGQPTVILTSNGSRELSDALRRRCLFAHVPLPSPTRELDILRAAIPNIDHALADQVVAFVANLRALDLDKAPGISETLDFARALVALARPSLTPDVARDLLGTLLKVTRDADAARAKLSKLIPA